MVADWGWSARRWPTGLVGPEQADQRVDRITGAADCLIGSDRPRFGHVAADRPVGYLLADEVLFNSRAFFFLSYPRAAEDGEVVEGATGSGLVRARRRASADGREPLKAEEAAKEEAAKEEAGHVEPDDGAADAVTCRPHTLQG